MRLWYLPNRLVLELDVVDIELIVYLGPRGAVVARWVDSETGAALGWVPIGRG